MLDNLPPDMYRKILEVERESRRRSRRDDRDRRFVRSARRREMR